MKKFPTLREVRLYFPNTWRQHVGDLVSGDDKNFNWFLCSQRYKDPQSGLYVAEISKGAKFYDEASGHTLIIADEAKVLIIDGGKEKSSKDILKILARYDYQGIAYMEQCNLKNPDQFFVCKEVVFGFVDGVLEISKKEGACAIIDYAKRNNECLRASIPGFPGVEEIEKYVKEYKCSTVCKVLYQDIITYVNK